MKPGLEAKAPLEGLGEGLGKAGADVGRSPGAQGTPALPWPLPRSHWPFWAQWFWLNEVKKMDWIWHSLCLFKKRHQRLFSLHLLRHTSRRDQSRWWPSANQEESARQNPAMLAPRSQISSLQNCEKINVASLSCSVCSILLRQPKLTKILPYVHTNPLGSSGQCFQDYFGPVIWRDFYLLESRLCLLTYQMIYKRIIRRIFFLYET